VAAVEEGAGPIVHHASVAEREDCTTAFMVVAGRIEPPSEPPPS
jgi:hypothetical protein